MGSNGAHGGQERSAPMARGIGAPAPIAGRSDNGRLPADGPVMASLPPLDFAAEYQRAYRVLWVVAAGVLGRAGGAEDVVQEAALLALGKLDQFQPGTHFVAWMAQMVRFIALNHLRRKTRHPAASLDDADLHLHIPAAHQENASTPDGLHLTGRGELPAGQQSFDDELMRALSGLTEVARACLLLRTIEGLDYEEIGRVLGIPEGTAMSHVHRSRMRLRERLGDRMRPTRRGEEPTR